jgi:YgiT-type zinc finger domain-containing protein
LSEEACEACGHPTIAKPVHLTLWADRGLVVIENVPARVCENCQEQFYDEEVSSKILQLSSSGFPPSRMVREITVPVYSLEAPAESGPGERKKD